MVEFGITTEQKQISLRDMWLPMYSRIGSVGGHKGPLIIEIWGGGIGWYSFLSVEKLLFSLGCAELCSLIEIIVRHMTNVGEC